MLKIIKTNLNLIISRANKTKNYIYNFLLIKNKTVRIKISAIIPIGIKINFNDKVATSNRKNKKRKSA